MKSFAEGGTFFDPDSPMHGSVNGLERKEEPLSVVRVFAQTPVSLQQLEDSYERMGTGSEIFFTRVLFSQKSKESIPSAGLLIPLGGEIGEDEPLLQGALREVAEESTLLSLSLGLADEVEAEARKIDRERQCFQYRIPGYSQPREVSLLVLPFRSSDFSLHYAREGLEGSEDKIAGLVELDPSQVRSLMYRSSAYVDGKRYQTVGHLSFSDTDDPIEIEPAEAKKRSDALQTALYQIHSFEMRVRRETLEEVNRIRAWERRGMAYDLGGCTYEEVKKGFVAAQMRLGFIDEQMRDAEGGERPAVEADKLKLSHYAMGVRPSELPEFLMSLPLRGLIRDVNRIKRPFKRAILTLVEEEEREEIAAGLSSDRGANFYDTFSGVWRRRVLGATPAQRREAIFKANQEFEFRLARQAQVPVHVIRRARDVSLEFLEEFTGQSLQTLEKFRGMPQVFRQLNEVSNATVFELVAMSLGFHPNIEIGEHPDEEITKLLRSESMIATSCFISAIEAVRQLERVDNKLFESCLDSFLVFPPNKDIIDLGEGMFLPVFHRILRVNRDQLGELWPKTAELLGVNSEGSGEFVDIHLIVDERRKKQEKSRLRKSIQDPDMDDAYSTNLVLAEDNFEFCGSDDCDFRLRLAERVGELLLEHIGRELEPDGWKVAPKESTLDTSRFEAARQICSLTQDERCEMANVSWSGKRAGSQGKRILREKMIVEMSREEDSETCLQELNIYPFENMEGPSAVCLKEAGVWSAKDKWRDDLEGRYNAMRLIMRDGKRPTDPSALELVAFPPLNQAMQERLRGEQIRRRKDGSLSSLKIRKE